MRVRDRRRAHPGLQNQLKEDQAKLIHQDVVALWLLHDDWQALRIRRGDHDEPLLIGPHSPDAGYSLEDLLARLRFWAATAAQAVPPLPKVIQRLHQQDLNRKKITLRGGDRAHRWFLPPKYIGNDRGSPDRHAVDAPPPVVHPIQDF